MKSLMGLIIGAGLIFILTQPVSAADPVKSDQLAQMIEDRGDFKVPTTAPAPAASPSPQAVPGKVKKDLAPVIQNNAEAPAHSAQAVAGKTCGSQCSDKSQEGKSCCEGKSESCCQSCPYCSESRKGFISLSPRYFSNSNNRASGVSQQQGFGEFNSGMFNFQLLFGRRYSCGFESGILISSAIQQRGGGSDQAQYDFVYGGLYGGYDFLKSNPLRLVLGGAFSYGSTHLEIFSGTAGGRTTERALFFEPRLSVAYPIAKHVDLGLGASYLVAFERKQDVLGQDFGTEKISPRGFTAGLEVTFRGWKKESAH